MAATLINGPASWRPECIREARDSNLGRSLAIMTKVSVVFLSPLKEKPGQYVNYARSLPSKSFPFTLPFDAT